MSFAGLACSKSAQQQGATGVARVVVQPLTADPAIARVTVTVSGGQVDPPFTPVAFELVQSGAQWIGRITNVPAGRQRQFDVKAFDAPGTVLYTGAGTADITAGSATVLSLTLNNRQPGTFQSAFPVIDAVTWSPEVPAPSSVVQFTATAHDPDPSAALTYQWTASCGSFDNAAARNPKWTAPAQQGACRVSLAVTDNHGATVGLDITLTVATGGVGSADVTIAFNRWPVIASLGGNLSIVADAMDGDLSVQASDPDGDALAYTWTSTCTGLVFTLTLPSSNTSPHIHVPLASLPCEVQVDVSDGVAPGSTTGALTLSPENVHFNCQNVVCPAGQACDPVDGICKVGGACTPACSGKACGPDGCGGVCGACPAGRSCDANGQCVAGCSPACTGKVCGPDACGGTCGTCTAGRTCDATGQCAAVCTPACTGKACGPDGCGGTCGTCAAGTTCDATGQCAATVPSVVPAAARDLQISPPAFLTMDPSGNTFVVGNIITNVPIDFQTAAGGPPVLLQTSGGTDILVAKYDPRGNVVYGITIGDDGGPGTLTDQTGTGVAITGNGTLGLIGKIAGAVTFGANTVIGATPVPFVAGLSAANGTGLWAKGFNLGTNGLLKAVSASPLDPSGRIAVCGSASNAAAQLVPGATFGGAIDLVVAVFDSAGNKLWAQQIGGTGNESCASVAVDDSGDVYATGQFDGASLAFCPTGSSSNGVACSGTRITLTGPGTTARKFMWVAKFAGATGNTLAAVAYGGSAGVANPQSLAIAPAGDVFVGGSFSGALTIGAPLVSNGGDDAFLAKLDHVALAPVWNAVSWGGTGSDLVRSIGVSAAGDAVTAGVINPSTAAFRTANGSDTIGAVKLSVNGTVASDVAVVTFNGSTGTLDSGTSYGGPASDTGDAVAVNRFSAANQVTFSTTLLTTATFGSAGSVSAMGGLDAALVFAHLQ